MLITEVSNGAHVDGVGGGGKTDKIFYIQFDSFLTLQTFSDSMNLVTAPPLAIGASGQRGNFTCVQNVKRVVSQSNVCETGSVDVFAWFIIEKRSFRAHYSSGGPAEMDRLHMKAVSLHLLV